MARSIRTRAGAVALLLVASSVGLTAAPAEAAPDLDLKRASKSIAIPKKVSARAHGRDVTVSWRGPSTAARSKVDRYEVRYRQAGQSAWSTSVSTAKHSLRVEDLTGGRRASFEVRSRDGGRASAWSTHVTAMPVSRPGRVRLTTASTPDRTVQLTWAAPTRNGGRRVERYEVMYRTTGSGAWRHVHRSAERATISGLRNTTTYSFRVRAKNAIGAGPWTEVLRARPGAVPVAASTAPSPQPVAVPAVLEQPRPAAEEPSEAAPAQIPAAPTLLPAGDPTGVHVSPRVRSVSLSWTAPTAGGRVDAYEVRVRVHGTTSWSASSSVLDTSAIIGDLVDGAAYDFSVRAVGPIAGQWSEPLVATPGTPTAPAAPLLRFADRALTTDTTWSEAGVEVNGSPVQGWQVRHRAEPDSEWTVEDVADPSALALHLPPETGGFRYRFSVRARNAFGDGAWSPDATIYVPVLTLPVLSVDTAGSAPVVSKDEYLSGTFVLDPNGARDADGAEYSGASGSTDIKGRGNSTWTVPKKPYRLKLGLKTKLLGMPANKNWVLLANYYDHSLLRNETALYLGSKTRLAWTPRTRYVEVLLNGDYLGLYQLAEQVRIDPGRIDIKAMKSNDTAGSALTGGYQLERDERWDPATEAGFRSSMGQPIALKDPEVPTEEQAAYIRDYVNAFESALQSAERADPDAGYAKYIDVDSFVDWYVVEEYLQNSDANLASVDFYKPRGGRLTMGPLWDFDLSLGVYALRGHTRDWYVRPGAWWTQFFNDSEWVDRVRIRWQQLRAEVRGLPGQVKSTSLEIATAAVGDQSRWGYSDHDSQVETVLEVLQERADWLDTQWG